MKFIDFILNAQKDPGLVAEFMLIEDVANLKKFFKKHGYTAIKGKEFDKILTAKKIQYRMSAVGGRQY